VFRAEWGGSMLLLTLAICRRAGATRRMGAMETQMTRMAWVLVAVLTGCAGNAGKTERDAGDSSDAAVDDGPVRWDCSCWETKYDITFGPDGKATDTKTVRSEFVSDLGLCSADDPIAMANDVITCEVEDTRAQCGCSECRRTTKTCTPKLTPDAGE
jgi:hypothetical protein